MTNAQTDTHMTRRLEQKLVQLASVTVPSPTGHKLRAEKSVALVGALLKEIDQVVLPRTLRIKNARGRSLFLDVSSRRLLRVRTQMSRGRRRFALEPDISNPDTLDAVQQQVRGFLKGSQEISLKIEKTETMPGGVPTGVSALMLAQRWGLPLASGVNQPPEKVMAGFLSQNQTLFRAGYVRTDSYSDMFGDEVWFGTLEQHVEAAVAQGALSADLADSAGSLIILSRRDASEEVAIARLGPVVAALILSEGAAAKLPEQWRAATGG